MQLQFTKMQALGNDFIVIDAINQQFSPLPEQIRFLADRHIGIGCDQLLLIEKAENPEADFRYRIFNADGGEVGQCGNGARCFARYVRERGMINRDDIKVETSSRLLKLQIQDGGTVSVDMGVPDFNPQTIPFQADHEQTEYDLNLGETSVRIGAVSMGNPHAVMQVADILTAPVAVVGPQIEQHPQFPERVNAGFMEVVDRAHIRLRVYERGSGETLACGSGACAAVAVGQRQGLLDERVLVELPGGSLFIQWAGNGSALIMTGPVNFVFDGEIML